MAEITQDVIHRPQESTSSKRRVAGLLLALSPLLGLLGLVGWGLVKAQQGPLSQGLAPDFSLTSFGAKQLPSAICAARL